MSQQEIFFTQYFNRDDVEFFVNKKQLKLHVKVKNTDHLLKSFDTCKIMKGYDGKRYNFRVCHCCSRAEIFEEIKN